MLQVKLEDLIISIEQDVILSLVTFSGLFIWMQILDGKFDGKF